MPVGPLRAELSAELVAQEEAVEAACRAVARMKAGLADPRRPFGVFLFVGPSGVGKTRCAQLLADRVFGDERRLLRVNLGDYGGADDHLRLFGNPHANAADQRRGRLSALLTGAQVGVLLLDELEKAHRNTQDALLPLLDEGRFVNGAGDAVSVRSFLVVATSNAGAEAWRDRSSGFSQARDLEAEALRRMRQQFRPEFLNRFDRVVPFRPLDAEALARVAEGQLRGLARRDGLRRRDVELRWTPAVVRWLAAQAGDTVQGARPVRHAVDHEVASVVAELIASGEPVAPRLGLDVEEGRVVARYEGVRVAA
jgi:ATP-dependent Clp protease ATP-binding subunit ClpA